MSNRYIHIPLSTPRQYPLDPINTVITTDIAAINDIAEVTTLSTVKLWCCSSVTGMIGTV